MKPDYNKKLQAEREKLNRLVDEALKNGAPIIMEMKRGKISKECDIIHIKNERH